MRLSSIRLLPKWDIFASVVLSRSPVIATVMSPAELRFNQSQLAEEHEKSLVSDFELKTKKDEELLAKRAALEREGKELSELDGEIGFTNSMRLDDWSKKAAQLETSYKLSNSRAYESTDQNSLMRALDRKLVLVVKQRFGDNSYSSPWILPQMKNNAGESLSQTAERCLGEVTMGNMEVSIQGNAPFSMHTHRYPKPIREKSGVDGAKLFFYSAVLSPKSIFNINKDEIVDFRWTNREEFWDCVPGKKYKIAMQTAFVE